MAGGIDWFRWHHGSVTDPKFQLVARRAGASLPDVLAVWAYLLEQASAAEKRGNFGQIDCEAVDCMFGFPSTETRTADILKAMQQRDLIDGQAINSWDKRQPKREDDTAAERKRRQREREHELSLSKATPTVTASRNVTQGHAEVTHGHDRGEESREDTQTTTVTGPPSRDLTAQGEGFAPSKAGAVGMAVKAAGVDPTTINLSDPVLASMLAQGATPEEFAGIAKEAIEKRIDNPWPWILAVLPKRREKAQTLRLAPAAEAKPWYETRKGIEEKGVELGLGAWDEPASQLGRGPLWPSYQARVFKAAGHGQTDQSVAAALGGALKLVAPA